MAVLLPWFIYGGEYTRREVTHGGEINTGGTHGRGYTWRGVTAGGMHGRGGTYGGELRMEKRYTWRSIHSEEKDKREGGMVRTEGRTKGGEVRYAWRDVYMKGMKRLGATVVRWRLRSRSNRRHAVGQTEWDP